MPNDDLGSFPMPPQSAASPTPTTTPAEPIVPTIPSNTPPATPPIIPDSIISEPTTPQTNTQFEETPETIPSAQPPFNILDEQEKLVEANEVLIEKQTTPTFTIPEVPQPEPATPVAATLPPKTGNTAAPIIIIVLLIVAIIGLAAAAYLSSQTGKLKNQLTEITQTLEKQETTLTPTPSSTPYIIPTPTIATQSAVASPSATPTVAIETGDLTPLKNASSALKIAINRSPNAQLILIKIDNATSPTTSVTKYFFREDLTTKKYFYVSVSGKGNPEIIDKQIYVTPDDSIPSLNDTVLANDMGVDLDEALKIAYNQCANRAVCVGAPVKAQYIKTSIGIIWQLSIYTNGSTGTPLMLQMNAQTKAVLYKSPEFANK